MELVDDLQKFWAGARMLVMSRQQGMTWESTGKMTIVDFLTVLSVTEKMEKAKSK